jgi:TPR repeat protein
VKGAARILVAVLALALLTARPAAAGLLSEGLAAYGRGDYPRAAAKLAPLAWEGAPRAQMLLGFMYATGRGVPQNYYVAVFWYCRAAEQGNVTAQHLLGLMYDKGQGVPQDYVLAHKWLNLAAGGATGRQREFYTRLRDAVATKMRPAEIGRAQWLAHPWIP